MVESPILQKDPHELLQSGQPQKPLQQAEYDPRFEQPIQGGGSMMQQSSFTPQMQTIESVDRQLTQGFNQPLPPQQGFQSFQQPEMATKTGNQLMEGEQEKLVGSTNQPSEELLEQKQGTFPMTGFQQSAVQPTVQPQMVPPLPTSTLSSTELGQSPMISSGKSQVKEYPCMKAILTCNYDHDEPEHMLVYVDKYPRPIRLKSDEILVKMKCSSINDLDYKICKGQIPCEIQTSPVHYPLIVGAEGCGIIEKLGGDPTNLRVGDCVFGFTNRLGTFGEYAVFKEREVMMKPEWMSSQMASTIPFSALAAMNCFLLVDKKRMKKQGMMGPSISVLNRVTAHKEEKKFTEETSSFEKKVIESSQSQPKLLHESEPINLEVVNQLLHGDKFGSILIQGGDTHIGSWCVLLARYYFGAQRIYTTIGSMDNEEYVRKLGADVILNANDAKYDDIISHDIAQYWEVFCAELDPQKHSGVGTSSLNTSSASASGESQPMVSSSTVQPPVNLVTTERIQEPVGFTQTSQMEYKPSMLAPVEQTNLSTSPQQPSPTISPITQWPHAGFKSKKEMEKCKLLVSTLQLSIDTVGGNDNMQKSFNLLNGSSSHYVTTTPPIELEQKKVSGKDVWKLVSMAATNRLKSFFANYPHFHLLPAVQCERELMVELVKWYDHLDREWIHRLLPFRTYPMSDAAMAMSDCKKFPFKLVINVSND